MASQFCVKCGSKLPENSKFCTSCGTPVQPDQSTTEPNSNTPAQQPIEDKFTPSEPQTPVQETEQTQQKPVQAPAEPIIEPAAGSTYYSTEPKENSSPAAEYKPAGLRPCAPTRPAAETLTCCASTAAQPASPQQWRPITPPQYKQHKPTPCRYQPVRSDGLLEYRSFVYTYVCTGYRPGGGHHMGSGRMQENHQA